ncbi:hypothetical protein EBZ39_15520, partial [bacterium]|nr:hypothetical protein [bacterium]
MIVASHLSDYDSRTVTPRWSATGTATATDASGASTPGWHALDLAAHRASGPALSGTSVYWTAEALLPFAAIDVVALVGTSFASAPSDVTVTVQVASDAAFSSGVLTLDTWTTTREREVRMLASRYEADASGGYVRVRLQCASAITPTVGEIWLGRRRQLRARPMRPSVRDSRTAGAYDTPTTRRSTWSGRYEETVQLWCSERDPDITTLRSVLRESREGTRPVLWIPQPQSTPRDVRLCA